MNRTLFILPLVLLYAGCGNDTQLSSHKNIDYVSQKSQKSSRSFTNQEQNDIRNDGLQYLNTLRKKAGMIEYKANSYLDIAAYNHAHYLITNNAIGHGENNTGDNFTGGSPSSRVLYAGYPHIMIGENVSSGRESVYSSIDGLFSAIYHRFGFLSFSDDEIGIGADSSLTHPYGSIYNYDMGISQLSSLCQGDSYTGSESYYYSICSDSDFKIRTKDFEHAMSENNNLNPSYILWPYDKQQDTRPVFYEEHPDPLPDCSVSGYPVSVQFNEQKSGLINLESFKLYDANHTEITDVRLFDKESDPNSKFSAYEFALFPMNRLDWDSSYHAEFTYTEDGTAKSFQWSFKTKALPNPYYIVRDTGNKYRVKSGQTYLFYLPPRDCNDGGAGYTTSYNGDLIIQTSFFDFNTIKVTVTGTAGTATITPINGRKFKLTISDEDDATYPKTIPTTVTATLKKDWNLIGANTNLTLAQIQEKAGIDNLLIIQGASKAYKKENIDSGLDFLNDFTRFEQGKGYWVKVANEVTIEYTPITTIETIPLKKGWNLINPSKALTLEEIKTQVGEDNLIMIQGPAKAYKKENVDNGLSFLNDFTQFEEPKGYWVNVNAASQLSFIE